MMVEWVKASQIKKKFHVSEDWLRSRRQSWKYGKHFIDTSAGSKPSYLYNEKEITAYLLTHPSQRS